MERPSPQHQTRNVDQHHTKCRLHCITTPQKTTTIPGNGKSISTSCFIKQALQSPYPAIKKAPPRYTNVSSATHFSQADKHLHYTNTEYMELSIEPGGSQPALHLGVQAVARGGHRDSVPAAGPACARCRGGRRACGRARRRSDVSGVRRALGCSNRVARC